MQYDWDHIAAQVALESVGSFHLGGDSKYFYTQRMSRRSDDFEGFREALKVSKSTFLRSTTNDVFLSVVLIFSSLLFVSI